MEPETEKVSCLPFLLLKINLPIINKLFRQQTTRDLGQVLRFNSLHYFGYIHSQLAELQFQCWIGQGG